MADKTVKVDITANASQATREFESFGSKVSSVATTVKGTMGGIQGAAMSLKTQMLGLGAALAGGAFALGIKNQIDWMDATRKSAQAAGVATQTYAEMAYAAKLADVDTEALTKSMARLASNMAKAAGGDINMQQLFGQTLHVKVQEAGGALRDTDQVMEDIAERFESMADGTKKVALAVELFGQRMGPQLIPFLNQGKGGIRQLREEFQKLKGVISDDQAAAAEQFNDNMSRAQVASDRLKLQIANAAIPTLVEYSNFFVDAAKKCGILEAAWLSMGKAGAAILGFDDVGQMKSRYQDLQNEAQRLRNIMVGLKIQLAAHPGNDTAQRYYNTLSAKLRDVQTKALDASAAIARMQAEVNRGYKGEAGAGRGFINPAVVGKTDADETGNLDATPKTDERMKVWEVALQAQKVAHDRMNAEQGTFQQFGKAREAEYWQAILATLSKGDKQRLAVEGKYYGLKLDMSKAGFEAEQAELQNRIVAAKSNYDEQEMLAEVFAQRAKARYGEDSKEYQQALQKAQSIYREHIDARATIAGIARQQAAEERLAEIDAAEAQAQMQVQLGFLTQEQLLAIRRSAIMQRELIELEAKQAEMQAQKDGPNDPVAVERIQAEIAAIKRKYKGLQDQNTGEQKVQSQKPFDAFFGTSQTAIEQGLLSMVTKMKFTLGGLRDTARQVGTALLQELVTKPAAEWIANQARMVMMTALFGQERVATEAVVGAEVVAVQAGFSLKSIAMKAYEAAAGAYSAIVGIPYVGPILAPIAAGVALAGVMAFASSIFSAEGGFDIPKGMNPMVQAHSNEMVLPSKHADTIRMLGDLAATGQLSGGGGGVTNIQALDSRSFERFLSGRQGDQLMRALARRARNGSY